MFFKNLCILVLWKKVASALEGLNSLNFYLVPSIQRVVNGLKRMSSCLYKSNLEFRFLRILKLQGHFEVVPYE